MPEELKNEEYAQGAEVPKIGKEVDVFVQNIDSLEDSLPGVMMMITMAEQDADERLKSFADKYGEVVERRDKSVTYKFKAPYDVRFSRLSKAIKRAASSNQIIPRVFVLALVSQFDAFLGRLLRVIFLLRPELMAGSERSLTLSQLLDLGTIEGATEYLLEKEVESVLRKSHVDQFTWMESKFNIKLREGLSSWPVFVELTERRNLFAHSNGTVSDQYLAVCKGHGVTLSDNCNRGDILDVSPEYFKCAYSCVYEIGVKLSQVLWRKLRIDQLEEADDNLIGVTYDLIVSGNYTLACNLLDFATNTLKKYSSEQVRLIHIINRAQAYKWDKNQAKCQEILKSQDWSACGPQFHLSVAVLEEDFDSAAQIMKSIGPEGVMKETDYQEWPLFKDFRAVESFSKAYESVFGKPFVHIESILQSDEKERRLKKLEHLKNQLEEKTGPINCGDDTVYN